MPVRPALALGFAACLAAAGQTAERTPHLGYLYPAGGQQGTTFHVIAGGQWLNGASGAYVSGGGLNVEVVDFIEPLRPNQIGEAIRYGFQLLQYRRQRANNPQAQPPDRPELPDHPLLRGLEEMTDEALARLRDYLNDPKRQPNAQIAEQVELEVTVAPEAAIGDREIRLITAGGLTNPMIFQVGRLPEQTEAEAWDKPDVPTVLTDLPAVVNGQILPGDRDRIRFTGRRGQHLVVEARARRLIPYLADAVPGWFQAVVALYDASGAELAYVDDFRCDPDPVLGCILPEDGEYEVEIRDSIYRGREDFVYRVVIGELPFVTQMFPLGGQEGQPLRAAVNGWNLLGSRLALDTSPGSGAVRLASVSGHAVGPFVPYAVDAWPELNEVESNDRVDQAQRLTLPCIVNGRIGKPGDKDRFQFAGAQADQIVAEVMARRLRSPLDSLLRLVDADGQVIAWNDDHEDKEFGLQTHFADSYLRATLPADGVYRVDLIDAQAHGGDDHAYRLRIGPPRHDFALRLKPSTLNMPAGRVAVVDVLALRKDGFDGAIQVVLSAAPAGFELSGGRIPPGCERVRMTLTAPAGPLDRPVKLWLEGRAVIGDQTVRRPVVPADEQMQAFLWTHWVPAAEFVVSLRRAPMAAPAGRVAGDGPLRLTPGGSAVAKVMLPARPNTNGVQFTLSEPPAGVTLGTVTPVDDGLEFEVKAADTVAAGTAGNLIIEVHLAGRSNFLGLVPAIPFEVVSP